MGAESERINERTETGIDTGTKTGQSAAGNSSAGIARTGTADTGRSAAGDTGRKAEKEKPSGVAVVNDELPQPSAPKKRQRKKTATKKKRTETATAQTNAEAIAALIVGVSSIAGSRPDMAHWVITPDEANKIAVPLANIIEKNEQLAKIAEHSDAIALTTAAVTVIAPRAIMQVTINKQKKAEVTRNDRIENTSNGTDRQHDRTRSADGGNDGAGIKASIPAFL